MAFNEILKQYGLTYEQLEPDERDTFHSMLKAVEGSTLTVGKIKDAIASARYSVEQELTKTPSNFFMWLLGWKRDFSLKARLQNYMFLESMLTAPDRAKRALEEALEKAK